jgi:Holliday junction resolvase
MNNNAQHSRLCSQIVGVIRKRGGYAKRMHGSVYQDAGIADVLACFNGRFLAIEVKTGAGKPTKIQLDDQRRVKKAGGVSAVVRSVAEVEDLLDDTR